jgi:hypothetical protein
MHAIGRAACVRLSQKGLTSDCILESNESNREGTEPKKIASRPTKPLMIERDDELELYLEEQGETEKSASTVETTSTVLPLQHQQLF